MCDPPHICVCIVSNVTINYTGIFMCTTCRPISMQVEDLDLQAIVSVDEVPVVVHGTYKRVWGSIKHQVHWTLDSAAI